MPLFHARKGETGDLFLSVGQMGKAMETAMVDINTNMFDTPKDPRKRLTYTERMEKRRAMMEEVDEYIQDMIQYCDDEEDLIALGSILQICSKNILTSCIDKEEWKAVINNFAKDVEQEQDLGSTVNRYRGFFY